MTIDNKLKFRAVAPEDIQIPSALLQDGLVAANDLHYKKDEASFVLVINRFCWERNYDSKSEKQQNRCLCGLKVGNVERVSGNVVLVKGQISFTIYCRLRMKYPKKMKEL